MSDEQKMLHRERGVVAHVEYDSYSTSNGKLKIWDADTMQWREPTGDAERIAALEELVLTMHAKLHRISNT